METPKTLAEAIVYFNDPDNALNYLAAKRWPNGVECPYCQAKEPMFLKTRRIWKCSATKCRKQFSVKIGTVLNESPIPLSKWLTAMWLVANCKNGVSSYEIARDLGLTQKTTWFMLHRIREAMIRRPRSWAAKSRLTNRSLVAKPATCTARAVSK
jgi:transposase-like protein